MNKSELGTLVRRAASDIQFTEKEIATIVEAVSADGVSWEELVVARAVLDASREDFNRAVWTLSNRAYTPNLKLYADSLKEQTRGAEEIMSRLSLKYVSGHLDKGHFKQTDVLR